MIRGPTRSPDGTRCNSANAKGYSLKSIAASAPVLVLQDILLDVLPHEAFAHLNPDARSYGPAGPDASYDPCRVKTNQSISSVTGADASILSAYACSALMPV
jgi:hypothetical protein